MASIMIFDDFTIYIGDWVGQLFYGWLNYYFLTVCLRYGEVQAVKEHIEEHRRENMLYGDDFVEEDERRLRDVT